MSIHHIISFGKLRHILVCSGLALFLMTAGIPADLSYAQRRYKPEVVLPPDYPNGFDGWGRIEMLTENGVTIRDELIRMKPYVMYHTPTNSDTTSAEFNNGDLVGYLTDPEGEIISLWLIQ